MRVFIEEQRFNQTWIIVLILVSAFVPVGIVFGTYIKDANSFSNWELFSILSLIIGASGLIFLFKLTTRIDEKGIHYKFFPFHWRFKTIYWENISHAHVRTYDALTEYGGWGLKGGVLWKRHKGTAINVSGNIGIQLELKNGKKLLIGTQKQNDAKSTIETYSIKFNTIKDEKG